MGEVSARLAEGTDRHTRASSPTTSGRPTPSIEPSPAAAPREAKLRFDEGLALHDASRDDEARLKFAEAYAAFPAPESLFNLARAEQLTFHSLDAIRHFRAFLRSEAPTITADQRRMGESFVAELASTLARVRLDVPVGTTVSVDGVPLTLPASLEDPIDLAPGAHVIEAQFGATVERWDVALRPGAEYDVPLRIDAKAAQDATPRAGSNFWPVLSTGALGLAIGVVFLAFGRRAPAARRKVSPSQSPPSPVTPPAPASRMLH